MGSSPLLCTNGQVAQRVERRPEEPGVGISIFPLPTIKRECVITFSLFNLIFIKNYDIIYIENEKGDFKMDTKMVKFSYDGETFGGIMVNDEWIICGCCGSVFEVGEVEIIETLSWVNISDEILGD